jgi:iron complex outermembrane recepter protein
MSTLRHRNASPRLSCTVLASAIAAAFATLAGVHAPLHAQQAPTAPTPRPDAAQAPLDDVVISVNRAEQRSFDAPAAIQAVTSDTIQEAGPQVNLSESLNRIPGVTILNRQNYAQDLQLSIRGFGARTQFGIRGVRLIVDGIPATMPDGQAQASTISLTSTERIEVLRGPLAQLYGNAAGGVVQAFTREAPEVPEVSLLAQGGSYGLERYATQFAGRSGQWGLVADYGYFHTDGFRENSATTRKHFNGRMTWGQERTKIALVVNSFDMPLAQDPGGLGADWADNPRRALDSFKNNRARKTVRQDQVGATASHRYQNELELQTRAYTGTREVFQAQSLGTWIGLDREYAGVGLQLAQPFRLGALPGRWVVGTDFERSTEDRTGGPMTAGDPTPNAALTRNQDYTADSTGAFAQVELSVTEAVSLTAGLRSSRVGLDVEDRRTPVLSGSNTYRATQPVAGISWHVSDSTNVYANVGRGFESPTIAETSYTWDGTAFGDQFNPNLKASKSTHAEVGVKHMWGPTTRLDAAIYTIDTRDEIVVLASGGGKTAYTNAARTERQGLELSGRTLLTDHWRALVAFNYIDATYADAFLSGTTPIPAGSKLPGIPQRFAFTEIAWAQQPYSKRLAGGARGTRGTGGAQLGLEAGLEWVHAGRLYANDVNTRSADGYDLLNARVSYTIETGKVRWVALVRAENVTNSRYVGSVIVSNTNPNVYEPAPGRNWLAGLRMVVPL